jgi:hypothetical protein
MRTLLAFSVALALVALVAPSPATARNKVTVPANVGVGPAGVMAFGPVFQDQPLHLGLKIWIGAVIDQETIQKNIHRIQPRYRQQASQIQELRYGAHILIPDSLIISPKLANTGILGVTWRPLSVGMPLMRADGFQARLSAGALLTYAFIWSDTLPARFTNFLRPGIDLKAEAEVRLHPSLYLSFGWASQLYLPQEPGPNPFVVEQTFLDELPMSLSRAIWHIGQPFVMVHYRFPYQTTMPGR